MVPDADRFTTKIFIIGYYSIILLYLFLQIKYWVFYLVVYLELNLIPDLFLLYFYLICDILGFYVHCTIVVLII